VPGHFRVLLKQPGSILTGIVSQWIGLPATTFLLVLILGPPPGIALGMFLIAACTGGNVSNYYSLIGKGNVALSVSITAFCTLARWWPHLLCSDSGETFMDPRRI
jgi:BASS family bile acid:Na+ symporter